MKGKYILGWKEKDEGEIKSHLKYARDLKQAEKIVDSKKRQSNNLASFAAALLYKSLYRPEQSCPRRAGLCFLSNPSVKE